MQLKKGKKAAKTEGMYAAWKILFGLEKDISLLGVLSLADSELRRRVSHVFHPRSSGHDWSSNLILDRGSEADIEMVSRNLENGSVACCMFNAKSQRIAWLSQDTKAPCMCHMYAPLRQQDRWSPYLFRLLFWHMASGDPLDNRRDMSLQQFQAGKVRERCISADILVSMFQSRTQEHGTFVAFVG